MKAKIVTENDGSTWLMTSANNWQWNGIQLRNPIEDAIVIRDVLNDFINSFEDLK